MTDTISKEERARLQGALDALVIYENNKQAAADYCNMPRSTYRDALQKASMIGLRPTVLPPDAEAKVTELTVKHKQEITDLKKQLKASVEENVSADMIRQSIFGLLEHEPSPPNWALKPHMNPGNPGTPTLLLSDWHYGEVVSLEEMGGINEYNREIAKVRMQTAVDKTIDLCFNHMVNPTYEGIVLALGGDMVGGEIHPELAETNDGYTMEHVFDLFDMLVWVIDKLAEKFGNVYIPCCFGNHGRNSQMYRFKGAAVNNYDWQLYCWLERHYNVTNPNVKFSVPTTYDTLYKLHGWDYVLTHGDRLGVRGGDGVIGLVGPVTRGIKKLKASYASQNINVDYVIMGHWHQRLRLRDGIVNGSGKGYDEFAAGHRFDPEPPQQCLWWTHPSYGITYEVPLFLEDQRKRTNKWVELLDG